LKTDKRALFLIFAIPAILIIIFGLTSGGGAQKFFTVTIITEDELSMDNFALNLSLVNNTATHDQLFITTVRDNCSSFGLFSMYNTTNLNEQDVNRNAALDLIKKGKVDAVIILPANFSESIIQLLDPVLIVYTDGSALGVTESISTALQEPITFFKLQTQALANFTVAFHNFENDVPEWKNQVLNYAAAIVLPLIIIGTTMNMTSLSIVSEEPLPRLVLTPSGKRELMFSKLLAYGLIMIIQSTEIFAIINLFGLYVRGTDNLFIFYLALIFIGLNGVCLGLAISGLARNPKQANQLFITVFIVITLFSNTFLPIDRIPYLFQVIAGLLPLSYATPLIVDIQLRGVLLNMNNPFMLLVLSALYYGIGYIGFKLKKVEV
jgi:ABC-2 type transport system permease protein